MVIKTDRALKCGQDTTANWSTLYGTAGAERVKKDANKHRKIHKTATLRHTESVGA